MRAQNAYDFRREHHEQWIQAARYAAEQREAWGEIWHGFEVDSALAEAVVFPEMVRFSKLQNYAEIAAVKVRYVAMGSRECNYSIGRFQMKPSFVETLEKRWMQSTMTAQYQAQFDTTQTREARTARINRMEDDLWQCVYLSMFIRLLYTDYSGLKALPKEEQVALVATAYNRGCPLPGAGRGQLAYLQKRRNIRLFHTVVIAGKNAPHYVYSDIALLRYHELR
ncbi:MAG: hypothetical protein MJZ89_06795 [Paludibacteraceae bacterium]|nr:hypothetical protein [Paludibacteraceae bacterium]